MEKNRKSRCERMGNDVKRGDCEILFKGNGDREFYMEILKKCGHMEAFHKAFAYCLGIDKDARGVLDSSMILIKGA